MTTNHVPLTLTVEEAAKALRIGKNQCYQAVRRGEIPSIVIGRRILISRQRLLELINGESSSPANSEAEPVSSAAAQIPAMLMKTGHNYVGPPAA
jgi:excisionase family DNA binding protein